MIGRTISQYTILEKLGQGGMGVVYKARDTKLDRLVALKFLPPHLDASTQDKARFVQEAKAAAALNHPNVCAIYDIQEQDDQIFIVMEFVDGQTLGEKRGTIGFKQAVEICVQVADGLAAAHEKGIVHRDIKPDNIMIRKDGIAQIMDFGLAKLKSGESKISRLTKEGSTIGTAGYMSPEQVQGHDTDHRSDIFSFGVLAYELLTGQLPFKGAHEMAMAYEIVNVDPPPMSAVKPDIDPALDAIILECLEKDINERAQSMKQISVDLRRLKRESTRARMSRVTAARPVPVLPRTAEVPDAGRQKDWKARGGYILSAVLLAAVLLLGWNQWKGPKTVTQPKLRFSIELPAEAPLCGNGASSGVTISPDGKYLVYVALRPAGSILYLHRMDEIGSTPIPGTEGASGPAFSPDGQWVAFGSPQRLTKVSILGGAAETICPLPGQSRGVCWTKDNSIFFATIVGPIFRLPASGGTAEPVTTLDTTTSEISHRFPQLLPDGKTLIYTVKQNSISSFEEALVVAQRLGETSHKILVRGGTFGRYLPTGHLMYVHGNSIMVAPFDIDRLELTGPGVPVQEGGWMISGSGDASVDVTPSGTLVFAPSGSRTDNIASIKWMDRKGGLAPLLDTLGQYTACRLSPDGQKIAVDVNAANNAIWVYQISRGVFTRLTFGGGNSDAPVWSPDGRYIYYQAERGGVPNPFRMPWDGSGTEERIDQSDKTERPTSFSPGGILAMNRAGDIWVQSIDSGASKGPGRPWPFIHTPAGESNGAFSPDGRWMAYTSNENGRQEIYVTSFPKHEGKWQISTGGGDAASWSRSGNELFYLNGQTLMSATVRSTASSFDYSIPTKILDLPPTIRPQDISPDGTRCLVLQYSTESFIFPRLQVVTQWFDDVKSKTAAAQN